MPSASAEIYWYPAPGFGAGPVPQPYVPVQQNGNWVRGDTGGWMYVDPGTGLWTEIPWNPDSMPNPLNISSENTAVISANSTITLNDDVSVTNILGTSTLGQVLDDGGNKTVTLSGNNTSKIGATSNSTLVTDVNFTLGNGTNILDINGEGGTTKFTDGTTKANGTGKKVRIFKGQMSNNRSYSMDDFEDVEMGDSTGNTTMTMTDTNKGMKDHISDTTTVSFTNPENGKTTTWQMNGNGEIVGGVKTTGGAIQPSSKITNAGGNASATLGLNTANGTTSSFGGKIEDDAASVLSISKTGNGTQRFSGETAYNFRGKTDIYGGEMRYNMSISGSNTGVGAGGIEVHSGGIATLENSEQFHNSANVTLDGGKLNLNKFSESAGNFMLTANGGIIDFGNPISLTVLSFSGVGVWTGNGTLSILNWNGNILGDGTSRFVFALGTVFTQGMLDRITFSGYASGAQAVNNGSYVEVTPGAVPEPAAVALVVFTGLLIAARRRWRRD